MYAAAAIFVLLLTTFARAQNSQFLFDPNGNLFVQTAEAVAPPQILAQPQNRIVGPDEVATFTVVAANTRLLAYQWRFSGTNILGATNDTVLLQNVRTNHEGEYRVVLTNPSGSVTSAPAFLMIDRDADGLPDSWELSFFGNLTNSATADFDGDGSSNAQEFLDDTNPTNSASVFYHLTLVRDGGSVAVLPDQSTYTNGQTVTLTATSFPGGEPFHAWLGDLVTRSNPVTLVMTNNKSMFARFNSVVFAWTNRVSGDWNIATNWAPNLVPGSNDSVVIALATGPTVTLNTSADCNAFSLGNDSVFSTLTGSGTLTVHGSASWFQGDMSGSGRTVIERGATLNISTPSAAGVFLNARTLENGGTVKWTGTGNFVLNSSAVLTNRPGALLHLQNAASIQASVGSSRIDNAGIFLKSTDSGTATVPSGIAFNNFGTVVVQSGTLRLAGGGTATGPFDTAATTSVEWTGGTFTWNAEAQLLGAGLYRINSGTFTANSNLVIENLELLAGTLNGSATVAILSAMNWTGGTMSGSGRTIISTGATLNVGSPSGVILTARTLENGGNVLFSTGLLGVSDAAVITNRVGAVFRIESETATELGGGIANGRFDNAGTLRKSANSGTTTFDFGLPLNNYGTVEIQTGTLDLAGGGAHSGNFDVSNGTTLRLAGGTHTAGASSSILGAGQLVVSAGTASLAGLVNISGSNTFSGGTANLTGNYICTNNILTVSSGTANFSGSAGSVSPAVLNLSNGTLDGTSTVSVNTAMNWTGGTMSGSGRTVIPPGRTLNIGSPSVVLLNTRTLENGGTVLWTDVGVFVMNFGAVITNRAGALFHVQNATPFVANVGVGRFDNAGTFRKSVSTGTTAIGGGVSFTNFGTVDIRGGILAANGGYASSSNAILNCTLGGTNAGTGYGQLQVAGTVTLNGALSVDFTNGFSPALNDSFTVLTAGTRNGAFASFFYPSNAVSVQLSNTPSSVVLRVTNVVAAVPAPMLLMPELIGSNVNIRWTVVSNAMYRLEFNPDLANLTNWNPVPGDVTTTSNTASKLDPLTPSNRLYRVRVLP